MAGAYNLLATVCEFFTQAPFKMMTDWAQAS